VTSIDEFDHRIDQVEALAVRSGLHFYWRGQSDARWGIHSLLHRRIAKFDDAELWQVEEKRVVAVEQQLMNEARDWVRPSVGARLATVDLLARLQHYGIPTRLIDFSRDPRVALWFASADEMDGRIIIAAARGEPKIDLRNDFQIPWSARSPNRPEDWSSNPIALDDQADFLRIRRQRGVFLVGGTPSTVPERRTRSGDHLRAADVRNCMSIPRAIHSWAPAEAAGNGRTTKGRPPTITSALSIRIPADCKKSFLTYLNGEKRSAGYLFPDPEGFKEHSTVSQMLS
jgi:hypothetical protein